MANRNRTAGNGFERKIVNELKEIFPKDKIVTSRAESRNMDALKVDVFTVDGLERKKPLVVIHNKVKKKGKNFCSTGQYVIMEKEVYYDLIKFHKSLPHNIQTKLTTNNPSYHTIIKYFNENI